jgi:hypothetical protein
MASVQVALTKTSTWILLFAGVGFGISGLFSGELSFTRDLLVLVYLLAGGGVLILFMHWHRAAFAQGLRRRWPVGVLVGLGIGVLLAITVTQQPGSPPPRGAHLAWSLVWLGLVYGVLDALLLNVLPVMVLKRPGDVPSSRWSRLRLGVTALAASMLVTGVYHLGYREFRGPQLARPLIGNAVLTAGYLLTGNPAAALLGHVIMHGAAVVHGIESTAQLPPHYAAFIPRAEMADSGRSSAGTHRLPPGATSGTRPQRSRTTRGDSDL